MWPTHPPESTSSNAEAVAVLLAGPLGRVNAWYAALMGDERLRVTTMASDPQDLALKLASNPEALLLDAGIFPGPQPLTELLTRFPGAAYVILPLAAKADVVKAVAEVPAVKGVFRGDANLVELTAKLLGDVEALRRSGKLGADALWKPHTDSAAPTGMRIIAVWNQSGGAGKTTLATNLAYEAARRRLPTLLVGLGAPDDLPLILGLKPEPNIVAWRSNPTPDGLKAALQKLEMLDVLAGFPDVLSESAGESAGPEAANPVQKLILTAAYAGYAVIVLDAPANSLAAAAISAANTLVLVAQPSLADVMRSVHAYRTVVERLAGEHRIPPNSVFVALNRMNSGRMDSGEWHKAAAGLLGRPFPPVIAQISDDPQVAELQDRKRLPILGSETFARGLQPLANALFSANGAGAFSGSAPKPQGRQVNLFGLKVKV